MDKIWIGAADRLSDEYVHGVANFLEFAFLEKEYGMDLTMLSFDGTMELRIFERHGLGGGGDLKDIWRWKHEIKVKYFLPHIDDLEFLSQSPTECVEQDQWKELMTYWKDEDVQKIARKNAINVSKKQCLHRTGRTSFAVMKQEMMMKGTDPSTIDVWLESRSRGKGFEDDDTLDLRISLF
ncbi:UNVERIFIED_CONTAM: hypothetical protein Slati_3495900 [Sesamum latifolium]|uniref:Uncharacterized protein n=1 Tax=Sesamum latifolium TaxID=2727402 RepID=A0AAW2UKA2_9LAMI